MIFKQESTIQRNKLTIISYGLKYTHKAVSDKESTKELCLSRDDNLHRKTMYISGLVLYAVYLKEFRIKVL